MHLVSISKFARGSGAFGETAMQQAQQKRGKPRLLKMMIGAQGMGNPKFAHRTKGSAVGKFAGIQQVYFGGDMEAAPALAGQSVGLIHSVASVQSIIDETVAEFYAISARLGSTRFA